MDKIVTGFYYCTPSSQVICESNLVSWTIISTHNFYLFVRAPIEINSKLWGNLILLYTIKCLKNLFPLV